MKAPLVESKRMSKMRTIRILIGVVFCFSCTVSLNAEELEDVVERIYRDLIDPHLTAQEQMAMQAVQIHVVKSPDFHHVFADNKRIGISIGHIAAVQDCAAAWSLVSLRIRSFPEVEGYHVYRSAWRKFEDTKGPLEYFQIDPEVDLTPDQLKFIDTYTSAYTTSAVFHVLAHEVAHHVLGHGQSKARNNAAKVRREESADRWACELGVRAGIPVLGAVIPLYYLHLHDLLAEKVDRLSTHPSTSRRIELVLNATLESLQIDEARARAAYKNSRVNLDNNSYEDAIAEILQLSAQVAAFPSRPQKSQEWTELAHTSPIAAMRCARWMYDGSNGFRQDKKASWNLSWHVFKMTFPDRLGKDQRPIGLRGIVSYCDSATYLGVLMLKDDVPEVKRDLKSARKMFEIAAEHGYLPAIEFLEKTRP